MDRIVHSTDNARLIRNKYTRPRRTDDRISHNPKHIETFCSLPTFVRLPAPCLSSPRLPHVARWLCSSCSLLPGSLGDKALHVKRQAGLYFNFGKATIQKPGLAALIFPSFFKGSNFIGEKFHFTKRRELRQSSPDMRQQKLNGQVTHEEKEDHCSQISLV